ncbi:MAG: sensor histidine kinase [Rhodospirillaceae bacterium]
MTMSGDPDDDDLLFEEDLPDSRPAGTPKGSEGETASALDKKATRQASRPDSSAAAGPPVPWNVLIVDDDPEVHLITRAVLYPLRFKGRALALKSAYSAYEAEAVIAADPTIAVILLDVVMETEDAGLRLVKTIREKLGNRMVRIILRTGQPGQAPEREVIIDYDINDYKAKTELTAQKLFTSMVAALRSYDDLRALEASEQKLLEANEQLELRVAERTADLMRSNKDLETFAYSISHDLKEPLRTIGGYLQLIERRLEDRLDDETREYMTFVGDGAARLSVMIDDLLDYAKLTPSAVRLSRFDLRQPIERALANLGHAIDESGAVIRIPSTAPVIEGDANQLARLFQNLLENAIKYGKQEEPPFIRVTIDQIDANPAEAVGTPGALSRRAGGDANAPSQKAAEDGIAMPALPNGTSSGFVDISITDNGRGIPPGQINRIFDLFHRGDRSDPISGTGVGLAICQRVVDLHHGALLVTSVPGEGSTFTIRLPRS